MSGDRRGLYSRQSDIVRRTHRGFLECTAANSDVEGNGIPPHNLFPGKIIMAENTNIMALSPRQTLDGQRVLRISGSAMKIATWNVRSLYSDGKLQNTQQEMCRLHIDILGISELRWVGSGVYISDQTALYYSGDNVSTHRRNGVAIMIQKRLQSSVKNFLPISDRVLLLQLAAKPFNINLIQVYAPTADKEAVTVEDFYSDIETALKQTKNHEITLVMGDFNSKLGQGTVADIIGAFGLGERNDRGDRLVQFCQEYNFAVSNTYFKLPSRRLYTWRSPADTPEHIVRNQIDFILINKRYRNSIRSAKTYPGADVGSDHNPVVVDIKIKLKKIRLPKRPVSIDLSKLNNPDVKKTFHEAINKELSLLKLDIANDTIHQDLDQAWIKFKSSVLCTGNKFLPPQQYVKTASWMTDEILNIMEERKKNKTNNERYNQLQSEIRRKIKQAKEKWWKDLCSEVESFDNKYDSFNMHKKIREMIAPKHQGRIMSSLIKENGTLTSSIEEKISLWEAYIKQLFYDERCDHSNITAVDEGPSITLREVSYAIKSSKSKKAIGQDEIPVELIKEIEESNLNYLVHLFNAIYNSGNIPTDWLKSTFVTLPKIKNPKYCSDYRTISLMSHVLKVFLKIIHKRIYTKCEQLLSKTQFGFRDGLGTRDALFGFQVLMQRCLDMNCDMYVCFIDYEKAFDRVRHSKLMEILERAGLDYKDVRFIKNLYWEQTANVRVDGHTSSYIEVVRGVRQGCILSPLLFNVYAEAIFSEALDNVNEGVTVNGIPVNNIRYADDTILIADSLKGLQTLINAVSSASLSYGIDINCKKTKFMVISRTPVQNISLYLNHNSLERVQRYRYLGTVIDETGDCGLEIRCRIEQARNAFSKLKTVLCDRNLKISLRMRIARCYVFSVLLYGVEAWTLTQTTSNKLEAFEMWLYRRMLRVSWRDRVRNSTVLQRMCKSTELLKSVQRRKLEYLGHIMRNKKYELLQLIIQGKIKGRRRPGRRRISWLKNLRQWFNLSTRSLFRVAVNKVKIALMVANLR